MPGIAVNYSTVYLIFLHNPLNLRDHQLMIEPCDKSKKRKLAEDDHSISEV
jgi:hypothetical protein